MIKKVKKEKSPKSQFKKTQEQIKVSVLEETSELESDSEPIEKSVATFIPIEDNPLHRSNSVWFKSLDLKYLQPLTVMLEDSFYHLRIRWEQEGRISKQRKEYLQTLYDKTKDIKTIIKTKCEEKLKKVT